METQSKIDSRDIRREISQLYGSREYRLLQNHYSRKSIWEILGVARKENQHSNFLAWLLDPRECHGLGDRPLRNFLRMLAVAKRQLLVNVDCDVDRHLLDMFLLGNFEIDKVSVDTEIPIDGCMFECGKDKGIDNAGRIDLLIMSWIDDGGGKRGLPLVIENKVWSSEHLVKRLGKLQTIAYYDWAEHKYADRDKYYKPIYVFLTADATFDLLNNTGRAQSCASNAYIRVNYQCIADHVITPLAGDNLVLADYLRGLSMTEKEQEDGSMNKTMAIAGEEKELCLKLWEKNRALLLATLSAVYDDPYGDVSGEEREMISKAIDDVSRKDFTRYRIADSEKKFSQGRMVLEIVKAYCQNNNVASVDELRKVFPDALQGTIGVVSGVLEEKFKQRPANFFNNEGDHIILKDGVEIAVCRQWGRDHGKGNIPRFVECAKRLKFDISECR